MIGTACVSERSR
jgi:hypothetical protein